MRRKFWTKRRQLRILNSFMGVFVGWATAFVLSIVSLVGFLIHEAATSPHAPLDGSVDWSLLDAIGGLFAMLLMLVFPLMMACLVSGVVSFIGWLLVGLPLAICITDRMANSFLFVVPLHVAATVTLAVLTTVLTTQTLPWRNMQAGEILFFVWGLAVWGLAIITIGSAAFCLFNRNVK